MAFHTRHAAVSALELTVSKFTSQNVHERLIINASMECGDYPLSTHALFWHQVFKWMIYIRLSLLIVPWTFCQLVTINVRTPQMHCMPGQIVHTWC